MDISSFILYVSVITISGALSPGPLTVATIIHGSKGGLKAGLGCALGHTIVELPLVILIWFGLLSLISQTVKQFLGIVGGLALIVFSMLQLRGSLKLSQSSSNSEVSLERGSILTGIMLSGLNPYFLLWWFSIGSVLVYEAMDLGLIQGLTIMYISHVWLDYLWLGLLAYLSKYGRKILGLKIYRYILMLFSLILMVFGVSWIYFNISGL
ncbi:LysE family transporter [Candidatus Bathyarchaeota archaeon]|nr:LysE family transporter [Candidatus Bathyarchaeota archaeon]MBS7613483.1 LysE family transporter [Candidatus Bathyarchaeota archaeon]MBS7618172.1 LysE family transporter [Candidatus Bathyarchaeota archaeon]